MSRSVEAAAPPPAPTGRTRAVWRLLRRNPQLVVGLAIVAAFVLIAVLSPVFLSQDARTKVGSVFQRPSVHHLLGTDGGGADMLALLVQGAAVSLMVGFAAAVVSALIGGAVGLFSGYFGGKTDVILMRITDYVLVIPDVPLMIIVAALFGRSLLNIILIIGAIYWTTTARLIRAQVKSIRERVYVKRARAIGAGNGRLIFRHVLPQVAPLLVANTVLLVALAIFAETFITFLGLGDPSVVSWGRLIENAFKDDAVLNKAWWAIIYPGACVTLLVLACTMIGQAIEDALNPRLRSGHLSVRKFRLRPLPLHGRLDSE
jgi:peptide/nickel transport system permease protein